MTSNACGAFTGLLSQATASQVLQAQDPTPRGKWQLDAGWRPLCLLRSCSLLLLPFSPTLCSLRRDRDNLSWIQEAARLLLSLFSAPAARFGGPSEEAAGTPAPACWGSRPTVTMPTPCCGRCLADPQSLMWSQGHSEVAASRVWD